MKTKEQVAEEIKKLLEDNKMSLIAVTRFFDQWSEAEHDVHLVSKADRYNPATKQFLSKENNEKSI